MDGIAVVVVNLGHRGRGVITAAVSVRIGDQPFAQIGLDAVADVADQILVGTPVTQGRAAATVGGAPAGTRAGGALERTGGDGAVFVLALFDTAVADEGAEDEGVGGGGGEEQFDGGV